KKAAPFGAVQSVEPIGSVFSPDGRWIVYTSTPIGGGVSSPNRGIYVQPVPASGARYQVPKQALDFHPVWGPKGTELFFVPSTVATGRATVQCESSSLRRYTGTDLTRPPLPRVYSRHRWLSLPAPASASMKSPPRSAKAGWARCIGRQTTTRIIALIDLPRD